MFLYLSTFARLSCLALLGICAMASADVVPLPAPDLDLRSSGAVNAIARQPDGKLIVGGYFTRVDDLSQPWLARLNVDGSVDASWRPVFRGPIYAIALSTDGYAYVTGLSDLFQGHAIGVKIPLSGDGGADPAWQPEIKDPYGNVPSILALDGQGHVYVSVQGWLRRLSAQTGEFDPGWTTPTQLIGAFVLDQTGHLFGCTSEKIIKVDLATAAIDPDWGVTRDSGISGLVLDGSGNLYIYGYFTQIAGAPRHGLARIAIAGQGSLDAAWNPDPGRTGASAYIEALLADGSAVVVAGLFDTIGGAARHNLAHLDTATGAATPNWTEGVDGEVLALAADTAGSLYVGGGYVSVGGRPAASVARLNLSGQADQTYSAGIYVGAAVNAMTVDPVTDRVYVGGYFDWAQGKPHGGLLRFDQDGHLDNAWAARTNGEVIALALDGNALFVSGYFDRANDVRRNGLAKFSTLGTGDLDAAWDPAPSGDAVPGGSSAAIVRAIVSDGAGHVYVGGNFATIGGRSQRQLARLFTTGVGAADPSWTAEPLHNVSRLVLDEQGQLFIVFYDFYTANIAKVSTADSGFFNVNWQQPQQVGIQDIAADGHGNLYVAGGFTDANMQVVHSIGRLSTQTGAASPSWLPQPADCLPTRLALDGNGMVYFGGPGATIFSIAVPCAGRVSLQSGLVDNDWKPSFVGNNVSNFAFGRGHRVLVGGYYDQAGGLPRQGFAAFAGEDRLFNGDFDPH